MCHALGMCSFSTSWTPPPWELGATSALNSRRPTLDSPWGGAMKRTLRIFVPPAATPNYRFLDCAQLTERIKNMHSLLNKRAGNIPDFRRLQLSIEKERIPLSNEYSADVRAMVESHSARVLSKCDGDSFQHIFWKRQLRAIWLKNKMSMQWHPVDEMYVKEGLVFDKHSGSLKGFVLTTSPWPMKTSGSSKSASKAFTCQVAT